MLKSVRWRIRPVIPDIGRETGNHSRDEKTKERTDLPELTPLLQLVEEMGLEITYAYDDLVFVEHSAFLFQFLKKRTLALYFNKDCPDNDAIRLEQQIKSIGEKNNMTITRKGKFSISQKENEEILDIVFFDEA